MVRKLFYLKIKCVLIFNKSILVHFSGLGNGSTNYYPDDLLYAINNTNKPRCASSVTLSMIHKRHQLWGEVGLILVPSNANSIIAVKKTDAGSTVINGKVIVECADENFNVETCLQAVTRDSGHDEWILDQFFVKGVFVTCDKPQVRSQERNENIDGMDDVPEFLRPPAVTDSYRTLSNSLIAKDLNLPVYEFKSESEFTEYAPSGQISIVNYSDLYKLNCAERLFYAIYKHRLQDNSFWCHAAAWQKRKPLCRTNLLFFIGLAMTCLAVAAISAMAISSRWRR